MGTAWENALHGDYWAYSCSDGCWYIGQLGESIRTGINEEGKYFATNPGHVVLLGMMAEPSSVGKANESRQYVDLRFRTAWNKLHRDASIIGCMGPSRLTLSTKPRKHTWRMCIQVKQTSLLCQV